MCQRGVFRTKLILAAEIPLIWRSKVFSNAERKPTPDADREGSNFLSDEKHALSLFLSHSGSFKDGKNVGGCFFSVVILLKACRDGETHTFNEQEFFLLYILQQVL